MQHLPLVYTYACSFEAGIYNKTSCGWHFKKADSSSQMPKINIEDFVDWEDLALYMYNCMQYAFLRLLQHYYFAASWRAMHQGLVRAS